MYIFGGHSPALYNAEAVKSRVQQSATGGSLPRIALAAFFLFAGQQAYVNPPSFVTTAAASAAVPKTTSPYAYASPQNDPAVAKVQIFKASVAGQTPPVIKQFQASPQLVDLTLQPSFSKPLISGQGPVTKLVQGYPLDVSQIGTRVFPTAATPVVATSPTAPFFSVPGQFEDRPTRSIFPSQVSGTLPKAFRQIYASPQYVDLTQQGLYFNPAGYIPLTIYAGGVSGTVGGSYLQTTLAAAQPWLIVTQPQFDERATRSVFRSQVLGSVAAPSPLRQIYGSPQQVDLTLQAVHINPAGYVVLTIYAGGVSGTIGGAAPGSFVPPMVSGYPTDITQIGAKLWPTVRGNIGPVLKTVIVPPQLIDLTLQGFVTKTATQHFVVGTTVRPLIFVPAQFDTSWNASDVWTPLVLGTVPVKFPGAGRTLGRFGAVPTILRGVLPLQADPTGLYILADSSGNSIYADNPYLINPFAGAGPITGVFSSGKLVGLIISSKIKGIFG